MSAGLSVIVALEQSSNLLEIVHSIDRQTIAAREFDLFLWDRGMSLDQVDRCRRIMSTRPNARYVPPTEDISGAVADWVLVVGPRSRLYPEAAARLLCTASELGADIVAARSVTPGLSPDHPFLADVAVRDSARRERALASPVLLIRSSWLDASTFRPRGDVAGASVCTLASYPSSLQPPSHGVSTPGRLVVETVTLGWSDGVIAVNCAGVASSDAPRHGRVVAMIRQLGAQLSFFADVESELADGRWKASIRVDPATAAAGATLPAGVFEIDLWVVTSSGSTAPTALPTAGRSGMLGGVVDVLVGTGAASGRLQIDVGPAFFSVLEDIDPLHARIVQSVAGSRLEIELPIWLHGTAPLNAQVGLGELQLPARIESRQGRTLFTAFVSGLPGDVQISSQYGLSRLRPSGLSLLIDGVGAMRVVRSSELAQPSAAVVQLTSTRGGDPKGFRETSAPSPPPGAPMPRPPAPASAVPDSIASTARSGARRSFLSRLRRVVSRSRR